jgi:group I intron endonuclease
MEVYFALNKSNGKAYVGWTKDTAPVRFKRHCSNAKAGSQFYFHRAIRKYGADAFDVLTVWRGDSAEEMKQAECDFIAGMKTNDQRFGYNLTAGGDGIMGHKHTLETRRKMVENRLPMTQACKEARSKTMYNLHSDPHFEARRLEAVCRRLVGAHMSNEAKAKSSATQKGRPRWTPEDKARIKRQRAKQVITPEQKAKTSTSLKAYLAVHPRENLTKFQAAGADATRGKPWTAARRAAQERRVAIRAK